MPLCTNLTKFSAVLINLGRKRKTHDMGHVVTFIHAFPVWKLRLQRLSLRAARLLLYDHCQLLHARDLLSQHVPRAEQPVCSTPGPAPLPWSKDAATDGDCGITPSATLRLLRCGNCNWKQDTGTSGALTGALMVFGKHQAFRQSAHNSDQKLQRLQTRCRSY